MMQDVVRVVREAGAAIERVRAEGFSVRDKDGQGPVTEADHASDSILLEGLMPLCDAAWLSEERTDDRKRLEAERSWCVDPLDGTKEFVSGVPQYAVSVGLIERGQVILAVIYNPAQDELFTAERGQGAFDGNGKRLQVAESTRLLASRTEVKRGEFVPFEGGWDIDPIGSIAYKLALIASGRAGCTFSRGPKWEWDVSAGDLLVHEAGGRASDVFGDPLGYGKDFAKVKGVLAGAPEAYAQTAALIDKLGPSDRMAEFEGR